MNNHIKNRNGICRKIFRDVQLTGYCVHCSRVAFSATLISSAILYHNKRSTENRTKNTTQKHAARISRFRRNLREPICGQLTAGSVRIRLN